mmetsp:Transcript_26731/g.23680  ORF Transcript_26731/g.23680 Transcript_26731/m.23680 type:complete len:155 (-) Transcript_26731:1333-1797(-)
MFKGNNMLWKDYSSNPSLPGFYNITLEIVSSLFKTKIVVYSVNDEGMMIAHMINNKHYKSIELIRNNKNHFDVIYSNEFMKKITEAQNIVLNIVDAAIDRQIPTQFQDMNRGEFINFELRRSMQKPSVDLTREAPRARHKRSLSDGLDKVFEKL